MRYTVTGTQMKAVDQDAINRIGIASLVLMERAALALADEAQALLEQRGGRFLAVCGTGNNGADGIAAARILHCRGWKVSVLLVGKPEHETSEHRHQQKIAGALSVELARTDGSIPSDNSVILDAIFGIGLSREVSGVYERLMEAIAFEKQKGTTVLSADIPSGIHAATGAVLKAAVSADVTVTFGYEKTGLCLYPGKQYAGRVVTADIGFSHESLLRAGWDAMILDDADKKELPLRDAWGNKGTFGKVLVIAGCEGMSGAAYLSALSAYRTGAGLVKILTVKANCPILQTQLPEAMTEGFDPEASSGFLEQVERACTWADVIVLGPGLGKETYVEDLLEQVLSCAYVPVVLDADGLNMVAKRPALMRYFTENIIVTPHMGEMGRLCGCSVEDLKADPVACAREYAAHYGVTCVMKDAVTVTADKDGAVWINESGCSAMAKAGAGDVLTGVIAGLLARGMDCSRAAAFGVFLHGLAGEKAAKQWGIQGVLAHNIADALVT